MNNRPNVAPDTAGAVWESVKELGYEPGGDGKKRGPKPGPRKNRQFNAMGVLMTGRPGGCLWGSAYLGALQGVQAALGEKHLNLALYHLQSPADARDVLRRNALDGIILFGSVEDPKLAEYLRRQVCVQVYGSLPSEGVWDLVSFDNNVIGRVAAQHLLGRGHDELMFIGPRDRVSRERGDSFAREAEFAAKQAKVVYEEDLVSYSDCVASANRSRLMELLRSFTEEGTDISRGVFLCDDFLAAAFYSVMYELKLLPSERVEVICCNSRFPHLVGTYPAPAVIDIHAEQVGRQAVDQALWRREHRNEPHVVRLVTPRLMLPDQCE
jgi:DNA-binding LacI/PurR family transcriptional regulator